MKLEQNHHPRTRSLVASISTRQIDIIDQTLLPFAYATLRLSTWHATAEAIADMRVRGAPLIGVTAAYGIAMAMSRDTGDAQLQEAHRGLLATRPTAVNLQWALSRMTKLLRDVPPAAREHAAWAEAANIEAEDIATNHRIGEHGFALLQSMQAKLQRPINILTHCNAGRMACVEWGTATAPIYLAYQSGMALHVWVEETRPRNQGLITQWELQDAGVPHSFLVDNAGGHLMQRGEIDIVIVGADRVAANGDAANKIGTYLKALAAQDSGIPFYVAIPSSTVDLTIADGLREIEIEERNGAEVRCVRGRDQDRNICDVTLLDDSVAVANPGFDVTPARLITGIITEHGVIAPAQLKSTLKQC